MPWGPCSWGLRRRKPKHGRVAGSGVLELVESHHGNAFRAVYVVRFTRAIYVLHCFQKKSPDGIRTAQVDVDLVHARLKAAQQHYKEHDDAH